MSEAIYFAGSTFEILDGTTPTPLDVVLDLVNGQFTLPLSLLKNATVDLHSNGGYFTSGPGEPQIPEFGLQSHVKDGFLGVNSVLDMVNGSAGGTYAARVFTVANTRIPHFNLRFKYLLADGTTIKRVCLENAEPVSTLQMDNSFRINWNWRIKGRIFLDGLVFSADVRLSRTDIPTWVTA